MVVETHQQLITALCDLRLWPDTVMEVKVIETHISSVILAGDFAYKIKKPLDLGFLDFSTLERRKHFCHEEIRLNRRLAPDIYLDVVAITGSLDAPSMAGEGEVIEYAVRMRRFPQDGLLSECAERLTGDVIDKLAARLVAFHGDIAVAGVADSFGTPEALFQPMTVNFEQIRRLVGESAELDRLDEIERWTQSRFEALHDLLITRKTGGFIRECHGDLHLGNITLVDGDVLIFDGIEFNPGLRWIDTISELAFLLMDLEEKGRSDLAQRMLNVYLELSGDYQSVALLRFYQAYRAMVRAKVSVIRLGQADLEEQERAEVLNDFSAYLNLAERYTHPGAPALIITHGLSGSGKSTQTSRCLEALPAVRLRSDVVRKQLAGMSARERSESGLDEGIYSADFSQATYGRLLELAKRIVDAGFMAIVDATFLIAGQREPFQALAEALGIPFVILHCQLPAEELKRRIVQREQEGADPSEAGIIVLERQMATAEPLTATEQRFTLTLGSEPIDIAQLKTALNDH